MHLILTSPKNEEELLERSSLLEGISFAALALLARLTIPSEPAKRKGWVGIALELALGATAGNKSLPDFEQLGIELKSLPINIHGKPAESTFICSIPLLTVHLQQWSTSPCFHKLKKILWIPVEGDKTIPFAHRRIGRAYLWSPDEKEEKTLANDWHELVNMIAMGKLEEIHAGIGEFLQVRPKAASSRSLCYGFDEQGNKTLTLPRGFYLRSLFTHQVLSTAWSMK